MGTSVACQLDAQACCGIETQGFCCVSTQPSGWAQQWLLQNPNVRLGMAPSVKPLLCKHGRLEFRSPAPTKRERERAKCGGCACDPSTVVVKTGDSQSLLASQPRQTSKLQVQWEILSQKLTWENTYTSNRMSSSGLHTLALLSIYVSIYLSHTHTRHRLDETN